MKQRMRMPINALLVGAAVLVGWWAWGWRGLILAFTVIVFWLVLQFNRAARVMRRAAERPKGQLDSVVMTQSRLEHGMTMLEVLQLTRSLGSKVEGRDEWDWSDAGGNRLRLIFRRDVLIRWEIARAEDEVQEAGGAAAATDADPPWLVRPGDAGPADSTPPGR